MNKQKLKLYRKVNTKTFRVWHRYGRDFRSSRNTKRHTRELIKGSMHGKQERGLDYTPLFRFLLSKVGSKWSEVFSEAKGRIDKIAPIYWIVSLDPNQKEDFIRCGESSYYSGLFVDENDILQLSNPNLTAKDMRPFCDCCTHTFNGKLFGTD